MQVFVSITLQRHRALLFECLTHRCRFPEILVDATSLDLARFIVPKVALSLQPIRGTDCRFLMDSLRGRDIRNAHARFRPRPLFLALLPLAGNRLLFLPAFCRPVWLLARAWFPRPSCPSCPSYTSCTGLA